MERQTSATPAIQVTREPEGLRVSVAVKSERFRTLLSLLWLLVWAAGEAVIVLLMLGKPPSLPLPLAGLFLAAFTAAGGFVLWRWLWCVGGRETFLVAPDALTARREIWGIGHSRTFGLKGVRSVKAGRLRYRFIYPSWGRLFIGRGDSQVLIDCAGRVRAYGKGLDDGEARDLADVLEAEMRFQGQTRPVPRRRVIAML